MLPPNNAFESGCADRQRALPWYHVGAHGQRERQVAGMVKGKFKRSRWKPGNVYALPLVDGSFGIAQAIVATPGLPGVLNIAVFDNRFPALSECCKTVARNRVIALLA